MRILCKEQKKYEIPLLLRYGRCIKMKKHINILFISDTHGKIFNGFIPDVLTEIEQYDYDICILLGDISKGDIEDLLEVIPKDKMYGILGNHDEADSLSINGITNLNKKVISFNGIKIAGIQGSFKYNSSCIGYTQKESLLISKKLKKADILVTHATSYKADINNDVHEGLKGITKYIFSKKVPYHFHGHSHDTNTIILSNGTVSKGIYLYQLIKI